MKIIIILITLLVVLSSFLSCHDLQSNANVTNSYENFNIDLPVYAGSSTNPEFELSTSISANYNKMMVYKVNNPIVDEALVIQIGSKLGFKGNAGKIDGDSKIAMLDETPQQIRQLSVWLNSGAIDYTIISPDKLAPKEQPILPSNEEATIIARDFLTNSGLMPKDANTEGKAEIGGSMGIIKKSGEGSYEEISKIATHILVKYSRNLDGFPVVGDSLAVRIGDKGEVISVRKTWREMEPYQETQVISSKMAFEDLISGKGSFKISSECIKVVIDNISLCYWMESIDKIQEFVVPVYKFTGQCQNSEGKNVGDFTGWCKAFAD